MTITLVAGARPNFMKIAPIINAIKEQQNNGASINFRLVHTGQHYDKNLSDSFFEELNIPQPDTNLGVKSGTQAEQTGAIMVGFEKELQDYRSDLVIVVGDVTSTMACSIVTKKAHIPLAHVEAGIRSGDLEMPEEINRMVTDSITDYFFTTSRLASNNLIKAGVDPSKIFFVGNVMIDTLISNLNRLKHPKIFKGLQLTKGSYFVLTLHRPSNVDDLNQLADTLKNIAKQSKGLPVIFPVHPRTKKLLSTLELKAPHIHFIEPLGYLSFIYLVKNSFAVLTDSGGITEEATVLNIPCITFRNSTERPETCEIGTNVLVGSDEQKINAAFIALFNGQWQKGRIPELWDGKSAKRIINHILEVFGDE